MVTTSPMTMDAVARTVRVRVVATNAEGTLGQGEVKLTTSGLASLAAANSAGH
jgi:hypothetical protein